MMVTQADRLDREACYEGRNQGNVGLKESTCRNFATEQDRDSANEDPPIFSVAFQFEQIRHLVMPPTFAWLPK
jgi:hypothetical protein